MRDRFTLKQIAVLVLAIAAVSLYQPESAWLRVLYNWVLIGQVALAFDRTG